MTKNNINPVKAKLFISDCKRYLQHKAILGDVSDLYKVPAMRAQLQRAALIFGAFIKNPATFPIGQIALLVQRNRDLIEILLPIPGSPSFESSKLLAEKIIKESAEIIDALNIND